MAKGTTTARGVVRGSPWWNVQPEGAGPVGPIFAFLGAFLLLTAFLFGAVQSPCTPPRGARSFDPGTAAALFAGAAFETTIRFLSGSNRMRALGLVSAGAPLVVAGVLGPRIQGTFLPPAAYVLALGYVATIAAIGSMALLRCGDPSPALRRSVIGVLALGLLFGGIASHGAVAGEPLAVAYAAFLAWRLGVLAREERRAARPRP